MSFEMRKKRVLELTVEWSGPGEGGWFADLRKPGVEGSEGSLAGAVAMHPMELGRRFGASFGQNFARTEGALGRGPVDRCKELERKVAELQAELDRIAEICESNGYYKP